MSFFTLGLLLHVSRSPLAVPVPWFPNGEVTGEGASPPGAQPTCVLPHFSSLLASHS